MSGSKKYVDLNVAYDDWERPSGPPTGRPLFITADLHFGHGWCAERRGFGTNLIKHDNYIIETWNATVPKDANVFVLGDFSFRPRGVNKHIFSQLNGRKYLIAGNHDGRNVTMLNWKKIRGMVRWRLYDLGVDVTLSHYPPGNKHLRDRVVHLHGHLHRAGMGHLPVLDLGWDAAGAPVDFRRIHNMIADQQKANQKLRELQ